MHKTSGVAGDGLGTTINYMRATACIRPGNTIKYLREAAGIGLEPRSSTCDAQRAALRANFCAPRSTSCAAPRESAWAPRSITCGAQRLPP
jgi:hypothetical protein